MSYLKVYKSNVTGKVPSVNDLDLESIGINSVDGLAWIKKRNASGVESIVALGGGSSGGSDHVRLHAINDPLDHAPVSAEYRDKILHTNATTGVIDFVSYRNDVRASGSTDSSVVTETGIRAAIDAAVSSVTSPWAVSGTNIYNTNAGNVGIGTSSPGYALDVAGIIRARTAFRGGENSSAYLIAHTNAAAQGIYFQTNSGGTTGLFVRHDGNVGIGTNSPGGKTHIFTNTSANNNDQLIIENAYITSANQLQKLNFRIPSTNTNTPAGFFELYGYDGTGVRKSFFAFNGYNNGQITVTATKFNLANSTYISTSTYNDGGSVVDILGMDTSNYVNVGSKYQAYYSGAEHGYGVRYWCSENQAQNTNHDFMFMDKDAVSKYLMRIVGLTGRVGVGTINPSSLLDVAGTVTAYTAKLSAVGTVAAAQLLGLDADKNLTTNVLPLVLSGIQPHTAGDGLSGGSYNGSAAVTWSVNFAGTGAASSVARSDHNHDSQYSAIGHNHYLVSLADVLITSLANGQVLRYNSTSGVWENGNADQYWKRTGTTLSPFTAFDKVDVATDGSNNAITGSAVSGVGVYGNSTNSYGVLGISANNVGVYGNGPGYGVYGQSAGNAGSAAVRAVATGAGFGVSAQSVSSYAVTGTSTSGGGGYFFSSTNVGLQGTSTNGLAMALHTSPADTSNIYTMLSLNRQTTGTAAAGIGISVDFQIEQFNGVIQSQGNIFMKLTNADSVTSAIGFSLRKNNASVSEVALMTPSDMSFKNENGYSLRLRSFRDYTGTPGYLKSGDYAGNLVFDAWSGASSYSSVAAISVLATADHNSSNFASKMEFWLAEPSSLYPRQVAELTPEGKVKGIFGFSVFGADGITGTSTIITGVSYDSGTKTLTFTRSTLTVSGGIVTDVTAASNTVIPLS